MLGRREYELTSRLVPGPREPIPLLLRIVPGAAHWPPSPAIVDAAVEWLRDHV